MSVTVGNAAEAACARYLTTQGLRLIDRNVKCRWGELDLIMMDQQTLVFVEVKARRSNYFGGGLAAVTTSKQQKLRRAAQWYLLQRRLSEAQCRFDVVDMDLTTHDYQWIRNAF